MGNENQKSKKNDLSNMAKELKPITPNTKGRACIIENGKVEFNFRHYKSDYDSLNKNLERLKNQMNIILSGDVIEMLSKKIEDLERFTTNENLKSSIFSFLPTYTTDLKAYYEAIKELKKLYKETYSNTATFLTNFLKEKKLGNVSEQEKEINEINEKMENIKKNWNGFSKIFNLLNVICYFDINENEQGEKINDYFNENKEEVTKNYNFENASQLRSMINLKKQIMENIKEKNAFIDELVLLHKEYTILIKKVVSSMNSTNQETREIAIELNEYNGIIIYHRLIRSIEERLKKINI